MSAAPLAPGDLGFDISGFRIDTPAKVQEAKAANGKFVLRYSSGAASDPSNPNHAGVAWKLITPAEHAALLADGFDVIANDEWFESRVTQGAKAGLADGKAARALWSACGHAKGATIYASWDQFPTRKLFRRVRRYERNFNKGLAGDYFVDAYAGTGFLRWAMRQKLIRFGWRPNAGSWSNDGLPFRPDTSTPEKRAALVALALKHTPAAIWQTGNYWFDKNADEDLIVRVPVGSHNEALAAAADSAAAKALAVKRKALRLQIGLLSAQLAKLKAQLRRLSG